MTDEEKDELAYDIQKIFWSVVLIGPFVLKILIILRGVLWPDGR